MEVISEISSGRASLDALVRAFIHTHLAYRLVQVDNASEARRIEAEIQGGALAAGRPLLNPNKAKGVGTRG
jgi:hypothetical protein